jgi:ElaB/YqjD/DUF883 family membrane-anchored ribosome-binding protein
MNLNPSESMSDGIAHDMQPMIRQAADKADVYLQHSLNAIRDSSDKLVAQAHNASDMTVNFIKREPVKSVLWAAASGAVIVTLISLLSRSKN